MIRNMEQVYPSHIYDPMRREIAASYIKRELKKYLPSIKSEPVWADIGRDIEDWFFDAPFLYPVRDFWNGLHGIMMGFKLLNHLTAFITAENVIWTKEEVEIEKLTVPIKDKPGAIIDPEDTIIVTEKRIDGEEKLVVYDGSNRVNLAISQGKKVMNAYVGRFEEDSKMPTNYWLPTSLLMEINHFSKQAYESGDMAKYRSFVTVFSEMLKESESARYEMRNRVIPGDSEYKKALLSDLRLN
jgi:hypothetical protein